MAVASACHRYDWYVSSLADPLEHASPADSAEIHRQEMSTSSVGIGITILWLNVQMSTARSIVVHKTEQAAQDRVLSCSPEPEQSVVQGRTSNRHHRPGTRRSGTCFAYFR